MTVRKYLVSLKDDDATAAAETLPTDLQGCPLDSAVGALCKELADATATYARHMDDTGGWAPESLGAEDRWELWFRAAGAMKIHYFG